MSESSPASKPSATHIPSWVMVGFVVGVLTMWAFNSHESSSAAAPAAATPAPVEATMPPTPNPLTVGSKPSIEAVRDVFSGLRNWVFWNENRSEFAVWNSSTHGFTDLFEVIRTPEADYFRPISAFTRIPIDGYGPPNSPILFTETAEQRARRYYSAHPDRVPTPNRPPPIEFKEIPPPPSGE